MELQKLIERASSIVGSDYKLAQQMDVSRQSISDWKLGRKPCPLHARAEIAGIAGFDALDALIEGVLEPHQGTPRGERLRRLLWRKR